MPNATPSTFTPAQLKAAILADANGLGLVAPYEAGSDQDVAQAMNQVRAGVGYLVYRKNFPIGDLVASIDATEYATLTQLQISKLQLLFAGVNTLDASDSNTRNIVTGVLAGKTTSLANLGTAVRKQGSYAEVLWGNGAFVTSDDVARTRAV